jgi:hypothetical protein
MWIHSFVPHLFRYMETGLTYSFVFRVIVDFDDDDRFLVERSDYGRLADRWIQFAGLVLSLAVDVAR